MATDWAADVKKYAPDADEGIIAGIVRHCGIALRNRDSSLVSFTDPAELARVRTNFLKKKLGLAQANDVLDAAIAKVGNAMKGDNSRNRVTVYYLLAAEFKKLDVFAKKPATKPEPKAKAAAKAPVKAKADPKVAAKAEIKTEPKAKAPAKKAAAAKPAAAKATVKKAAPAKTTAPKITAAPVAPALATMAPAVPAASKANPVQLPPVQALTAAGDEGKEGGLGWLWLLIALSLLTFCAWWVMGR